jgi:REP element-mobilizing transposase RayT
MYSVWLPNDPRGSWSDTVYKWELLRYGKPTRTAVRRSLVQLTDEELALRHAAHCELQYPPVQINGLQAKSIGDGFAETVHKNGYTVWACAILPQHVHLVLARHTSKVEQMATLLKGGATMRTIRDGRHPLADYQEDGDRPPKMWAEKRWKIYLDSEVQIENAIRYVNDNPEEEGKPR